MPGAEGWGWHSHVEGLDMSGKSTQERLAKEYAEANGIPFLTVMEPGGTPLGQEFRNILLHNRAHSLGAVTENFVYMADRNHTLETVTRPALEQGIAVSHIRARWSAGAYQGAGGGVAVELINQLHELAMPRWYNMPDAIAVLALSKQGYIKRRQLKAEAEGLDKIEERTLGYFLRVGEEYEKLAEDHPRATRVDAEMNPEEVFEVMRPLMFGPDHA
jgi:dTMP kinase